jgi:hypothetical protein
MALGFGLRFYSFELVRVESLRLRVQRVRVEG